MLGQEVTKQSFEQLEYGLLPHEETEFIRLCMPKRRQHGDSEQAFAERSPDLPFGGGAIG
jgi:hypothetical protein